MTDLKKGDRVKVAFEGVITHVEDRIRIITNPESLVSSIATVRLLDPRVSIEKLQDPEPVWVNGDVIKVPDDEKAGEKYICLRVPGGWIAQDGGTVNSPYVSRMWAEGKLDALLKRTDEKKVA